MKTLKWSYKIVRSILFTTVITVVGLFALLYIGLSIPPVQDYIRRQAENELSAFFGSRVEIGSLSIRPLNEIIINDAVIYDLKDKRCVDIGRLGAGINIWKLIFGGNIEITHVELVNFKGDIYQEQEGQPLNIEFIIKAFQPKEKNRPPTKFDLKIHNIVIRGGEVSFSRLWKERKPEGTFDPDHLFFTGLSADVTLPRLSNDDTEVDLRRLSFNEQSGLQVKELSGYFRIQPETVTISDLNIRLPESVLRTKSVTVPVAFIKDKGRGNDRISLILTESRITPSDFSSFYPQLDLLNTSFPLSLSVSGNLNQVEVSELSIGEEKSLYLSTSLKAKEFLKSDSIQLSVERLKLNIDQEYLRKLAFIADLNNNSSNLGTIAPKIGSVAINLNGEFDAQSGGFELNTDLNSDIGTVDFYGKGKFKNSILSGHYNLQIPSAEIIQLYEDSPIERIKNAEVTLDGEFIIRDPANSTGTVSFALEEIDLLNRNLTDISGHLGKRQNELDFALAIDDNDLKGEVEAAIGLAGENSKWDIRAELKDFDSYNSLISEKGEKGFEIRGALEAHGTGISPDHISGELNVNDFTFKKLDSGKSISLDNLSLSILEKENKEKKLTLKSELVDLDFEGNYRPSLIPGMILKTLGEVCPTFFIPFNGASDCGRGELRIAVKDYQQLINFFDLPVVPLSELTITGVIDSEGDIIRLTTDIPYILQGQNKLITDTYLTLQLTGKTGEAKLNAGTVYPTKKGLLKLDMDLEGKNGDYSVDVAFNKGRDVSFYGDLTLDFNINRNENGELCLIARFLPATLHLNNSEWILDPARIEYRPEGLWIEDFSIHHEGQYVSASGYNNREGEGTIYLKLADINLDYVFETLNIPNVSFGGMATGSVAARSIFGKDPDIATEHLKVSNLSYNGSVMGDGNISGRLDLPEKKIAIGAEITETGRRVATVDGGVWFGRDSLSFDFDAERVNIGFMQPFMAAFSSDVEGKASGKAKLYGTFSDIDMTGKIVTHDARILIDYINTYYTGSDTVYMSPGRIELPDFKIQDRFGNTAKVQGLLTHKCFHEPVFKFTVSDMDHLLVYDTNASINPLWYGTIFAKGYGEVNGKPGVVNILADVETEEGSDFTFVLSDQQEVEKSHFLTFSDRKKASRLQEMEVKADTVPEIVRNLMARKEVKKDIPSVYNMEFRVSVNNDIRFNLVMDPIGGDKIVAYGNGAMTLTYTSLTDELKLFGKYILDKGTYNFTLQDIILKDFIIKPGSSIAFTGNPYAGVLDIVAAYRVNTSLTELDKSFAMDRELNRTSVPVDALLKVTGLMTAPHIGFDIELPTVTEETSQKVRSIISTEDMMSRQVLYLVALNKFYPPEYMATSNSGGEWASIASSTISSQLQNMIGQLTDKFTVAPSIRSDKGDFSDIEVDLALSSQLFNNRLLINGNIGYRDPSNSSTTFVGDFDIEYLLNKQGTWRLKAYNHFNDQNYYLKSALTTQGLGIVWRKEFGKPVTIIKERIRPKDTEIEETESEE